MIGVHNSYKIYMSEIQDIPSFSREEQEKLASEIKPKGKLSAAQKDKLVLSNLRLVVKIAIEYKNFGVDLEDLINEGNIGLMTAVEYYKPDKSKFPYYAGLWIRQKITRFLSNHSRPIRVPVLQQSTYSKILKLSTTHKEKYGESPSEEVIAKELGLTVARVRKVLTSISHFYSLDQRVDVEDLNSQSFKDVIPDDSCGSPSVHAEENDKNVFLKRMFRKLNKNERIVIKNRFGINGPSMTLAEVGEKIQLTRERVRQIEEKALDKMRAYCDKNKIVLF